MSKLIFAYTPHEIMPAYINIYEDDGKITITVRSSGAREVSQIEMPFNQMILLEQRLRDWNWNEPY